VGERVGERAGEHAGECVGELAGERVSMPNVPADTSTKTFMLQQRYICFNRRGRLISVVRNHFFKRQMAKLKIKS
jgi:hypothetical protein